MHLNPPAVWCRSSWSTLIQRAITISSWWGHWRSEVGSVWWKLMLCILTLSKLACFGRNGTKVIFLNSSKGIRYMLSLSIITYWRIKPVCLWLWMNIMHQKEWIWSFCRKHIMLSRARIWMIWGPSEKCKELPKGRFGSWSQDRMQIEAEAYAFLIIKDKYRLS